MSGAPFVTWAEFYAAHFRFVRGTPRSCEPRADVTRQFCAHCGTQLTYRQADGTGVVDVTVGSLDAPEAIVVDDHVWCDRMLPWIRFDDGLPRYAAGRAEHSDAGGAADRA